MKDSTVIVVVHQLPPKEAKVAWWFNMVSAPFFIVLFFSVGYAVAQPKSHDNYGWSAGWAMICVVVYVCISLTAIFLLGGDKYDYKGGTRDDFARKLPVLIDISVDLVKLVFYVILLIFGLTMCVLSGGH